MIKRITWCLIGCCGMLFTACVDDKVNESQENGPLPEIAILEEVQQVRWDKQQLEALIQSAIFLNNTTAAHNLLSHLQQAEPGFERNDVREVLKRMTCDPERIILERLRTEGDPAQKRNFMLLLKDFQSEEGFLVLVEHFDDTRRADFDRYPEEQPAYPTRVCDIAYDVFIWKLSHLEIIAPRQFSSVLHGRAYEGRDQLIVELKAYWEEHKAFLLKCIQEKAQATPISSP